MQIQHNTSLLGLNTMAVDVRSAAFASFQSVHELKALLKPYYQPLFILGGGSNVLFTRDFPGLVLRNEMMGREVIQETDDYFLVQAGAGEPWHPFVLWSLEQNAYGLENLSLIPGSVGAAPIQNIGAYGVELKDVFHELQALHIASQEIRTFSKEECAFGYRDSVFKNALKGAYVILGVTFRLQKSQSPNTSYGMIQKTLAAWGINEPSPEDVSRAVIHIRSSKLPDPAELPNTGSFFKNPVIDEEEFKRLKCRTSEIVFYEMPNNQFKIPAGWLIEQTGWKGKRDGAVGTYEKQALVLVNHGGATGPEVWAFAQQVQQAVEERFGIRLEPEVNIVG
ncbi:MAG: UDP-N-acetylmuramate dehydrogenase [Bacteroidota bacterium]